MTCRLVHGGGRCVALPMWGQVCLSSLPATGWACYLRSLVPVHQGTVIFWMEDFVGMALRYCLPGTEMNWGDTARERCSGWPAREHHTGLLSSSVLAVSPLGPGPERLPQMWGWQLQEHRWCPGRALRSDGPGVGTAVTPSCPLSAPGHRRSSRGHILSSHPHLCPMRTGAPWPWVCSPVGSPLSQPFLRHDASPRGLGAGIDSFPPWWRLWRVGALGTGQPGQPCQCLSDGITGREKRPYVLTQKVSIKDLHFGF